MVWRGNNLNILFLTAHLKFGGITTYVTSLAGRLNELGHRVKIASAGGEMVPEIEKAGIEHIKINVDTSSELNPILFKAGTYLRRIITREEQIDIIHAQTRVTQVLAHLVCRTIPDRKRPILVTTCHGFFKPHLMRKIFPCWGDRVIAISEAVREHLVNDLQVPKGKISMLPNGVDINKFIYPVTEQQRSEYKRRLGLEGGWRVIGIIARLSPVKGQRYLVEAFRYITEKNHQVYLIIVGDGPDKEMLVNLARQLDITDKVRFLPGTRDTAPLLAAMDVFVMPSLQEGLGLSIMEAMAAGLPVVASDVGGIYTIIKERRTGFLVPPRDGKALAEAVIKLLEDCSLCKRIGQQARKFIEDNFSLDIMTSQVEKLYRDLLAVENEPS